MKSLSLHRQYYDSESNSLKIAVIALFGTIFAERERERERETQREREKLDNHNNISVIFLGEICIFHISIYIYIFPVFIIV
jgi:Na+/melibiose symporter-like transporter